MKYLILTLTLASFGSMAAEIKEMSDKELGTKAVAVIKDAEIDKQLDGLSVFKECRDKNKFDPDKIDQTSVDANLQKAVDCFKQKIGANKDPKKLEELSNKLNLQGYGLIQSKNVKDVSKYLSNKMYKSMTGIDKSSADLKAVIASMRFKNRKMIDQQDLLELYKTQLVKSSLYEISRYCFQDLRNTTNPPNPTNNDFESHWGSLITTGTISVGLADLTDTGVPTFFPLSNKETAYADIVNGISPNGTLSGPKLQSFFNFCSSQIRVLCEDYESKMATTSSNSVGSGVNVSKKITVTSKGSKSCLVKSRLQEIRKAISNTDKIMEDWKKKTPEEVALLLDGNIEATFYDGSKDASFDQLTSQSSEEIMNGAPKDSAKYDELQRDCATNTTSEECKQFLVVSDTFNKAQQNMDMELKLKRELALERVRQLKQKNDKSLAEYLQSEGHLKIHDDLIKGVIKPEDVEQLVSNALEAKRIGALEALKASMGKRQVSEKDAKIAGEKEKIIKENIEYSRDERARLAQVVMFNNIITSNLSLKDQSGKDLGKNLNAYNTEAKGFEKSKAQSPLFSNLKEEIEKGPKATNTAGASVLGTGILDTILGAPPK